MQSRMLVVAAALLTLSACGSGGGNTPPPVTYTIGGTLSGLSGTGLVLQDNGGNNLSVGTSGAFTFALPIASGSRYNVTVITQPSGPSQNCVVTNGGGAATANVTNVQVACVSEWTWGEWIECRQPTGNVRNIGDTVP